MVRLIFIIFLSLVYSQNAGMYFSDGFFISAHYSGLTELLESKESPSLDFSANKIPDYQDYSYSVSLSYLFDNKELFMVYSESSLEYNGSNSPINNQKHNNFKIGVSRYFKTKNKKDFLYGVNFKAVAFIDILGEVVGDYHSYLEDFYLIQLDSNIDDLDIENIISNTKITSDFSIYRIHNNSAILLGIFIPNLNFSSNYNITAFIDYGLYHSGIKIFHDQPDILDSPFLSNSQFCITSLGIGFQYPKLNLLIQPSIMVKNTNTENLYCKVLIAVNI